ncbi:DMT family transporter [Vibrio atypicus]|uniref:DMT family transporter n=1 Tax=Vibrio atypicus TaxID=558271 RepID=UPI001358845B|nr:DMT family transporter [Vibrio atypicus]
MKSFEKRKLIKGFGYGALTVGCWGILNVTTHEALSSGFLPNDLTMLRYCVAGIICLPLLLINLRGVMQITNWLRATAFSLLAGPMYGWLVNKGMQLTPLSYASVMVPTFTMIITMAFLSAQGEKINKAQIGGIGVIVFGLYLLINRPLGAELQSSIGATLFLLAGLAWALFALLLKRWQVNLVSTIFMMNVISGIIYLPVYLRSAHSDLSALPIEQWITQTFVQSVLASIVVVFTFARAVNYLGATVSSTLPALIPLVSIFLASFWFGHVITDSEKFALAMISCGFVVCTVSKRNRQKVSRDSITRVWRGKA